jgi:hypothetical protein
MRRWAAAVAAVLAVTACSPGAREPAAGASTAEESSAAALPTVRKPADPMPGIDAEAVQLRTDKAAGGRIQVRVTASDEFSVTSVAVDSPGFEALPPTELTADFRPGRVIDLRTPIGAAQCDVSPVPSSARLTVVRPGGQPEEVDVPLAADVLQQIHADECAEQALAEDVAIEVVDLRDDGDGLAGSLALTRKAGEGEVRVISLRRSVLMAADVDLPLTMAADASDAATPLRFTPATCDAHVLAETKQPFLFPMTVQVGDREPVDVELPVPDDLRKRLQALVQRVCH